MHFQLPLGTLLYRVVLLSTPKKRRLGPANEDD